MVRLRVCLLCCPDVVSCTQQGLMVVSADLLCPLSLSACMVVLASSQEDGCAAAGAGADVQPHSTPTSPDGDPRAEDAEFQAVLLAGGRCARMFPLTEKCPKALLPVANRPVIDYGLDLLEKAGFSRTSC